MDPARWNWLLGNVTIVGASIVGLILIVLMPARVLQRRHGYSPWLLLLGLVPYAGPLCMLWGLAVSTPTPSDLRGQRHDGR